jgi:uncharacterized protein DUF1707
MGQRASLKASDADREHIAERLRQATAEGRLLAEELEQRLGAALCARTYGELDAVVADLPGERLQRRRQRGVRPWLLPAVGLALAIPLALAIIAAVLFVVTGVLAAWMLWAAIAWWCFGHKHRYYGSRSRSYRNVSRRGAGIGGARRPQARPGFWL